MRQNHKEKYQISEECRRDEIGDRFSRRRLGERFRDQNVRFATLKEISTYVVISPVSSQYLPNLLSPGIGRMFDMGVL